MKFERARTDEQILDRKKEIIDACAKLYDQYDIEGVNFKAIGEITSFSRSSIYKYFTTKEEILLSLLLEDIRIWTKELKLIMQSHKSFSKEDFCQALATTFSNNKRMIRLLSMSFMTLEKNCSLEQLTAFKRELIEEQTVFASFLNHYFPNTKEEEKHAFIQTSTAYIVGLFPMTHSSQKQLEAIKLSGYKIYPLDFSTLCYEGLLKLSANL